MMYRRRVDCAKRRRLQARVAMDSLFQGTPPRFALYDMERPSGATRSFHEYLRDLGLANDAHSTMPAALMAILNWAAPSTISAGSQAVQESLLNSSLNTVGLDGLFGVGFITCLGAEKGLMYTIEELFLND
jgi:hypothetical protein